MTLQTRRGEKLFRPRPFRPDDFAREQILRPRASTNPPIILRPGARAHPLHVTLGASGNSFRRDLSLESTGGILQRDNSRNTASLFRYESSLVCRRNDTHTRKNNKYILHVRNFEIEMKSEITLRRYGALHFVFLYTRRRPIVSFFLFFFCARKIIIILFETTGFTEAAREIGNQSESADVIS